MLTRPWHGGAPGLSRPPPWGQLLESTLGSGQHLFDDMNIFDNLILVVITIPSRTQKSEAIT